MYFLCGFNFIQGLFLFSSLPLYVCVRVCVSVSEPFKTMDRKTAPMLISLFFFFFNVGIILSTGAQM